MVAQNPITEEEMKEKENATTFMYWSLDWHKCETIGCSYYLFMHTLRGTVLLLHGYALIVFQGTKLTICIHFVELQKS